MLMSFFFSGLRFTTVCCRTLYGCRCTPPRLSRALLPPHCICAPPLLLQERKSLIGQKLNEKHNNWGSLLLGLGVLISVSGAFNTFLRTGECMVGCVLPAVQPRCRRHAGMCLSSKCCHIAGG